MEMGVLFDHQIFCYQAVGGVPRYFAELIRELRRLELARCEVSFALSTSAYLEQYSIRRRSRLWTGVRFRGKERLTSTLNVAGTLLRMRRRGFDVFHPTYFDPYFLPHLEGAPFVLTVYDMIHELRRDEYAGDDHESRHKRQLCREASRIVAISESTRRDILRLYTEVPPQKVITIHLAQSTPPGWTETVTSARSLSPYLLFVGRRGGYKNFASLLGAMPALRKLHSGLRLVCAGGGQFTYAETRSIAELGLQECVHQVFPSDAELWQWYSCAAALVYPSAYEGFGLPVLEAFSTGCPVVAAPISSIHEVGCDAVAYFSLDDSSSLVETIDRVLADPCYSGQLSKRGRARASDFSWEATARATATVYRQVLESTG